MKKRWTKAVSKMTICGLCFALSAAATGAAETRPGLGGAVVAAIAAEKSRPSGAAGSGSGSDTVESDLLVSSYEYHLEDGTLKYRLDLGGELIRLHCFFRSGDPDYHEEIYTLPLENAYATGGTMVFGEINNQAGIDISSQFAFFAITFTDHKAVLSAVRRETTLAGGTEGSIMTGTYAMTAQTGSASKGSISGSADAVGKCVPGILCRMAQSYYYRHEGYYPPVADYTDNGDGTYAIHLYEIVDEGNGTTHTATSAWYTVDNSGTGTDSIFGNAVDLRQ